MNSSDESISIERESVQTMLTALTRLRGIFNPDLAVLRENAPGMAAFAERTESGIARLQTVLDANDGTTLSLPREVVEALVARLKRLRGNFNPDPAALQKIAPGIAAFTKRLETAAAKLEAALQ